MMKIEKLDEKHIKECSLLYVETFNSEPWNDKWDKTTSFKRLKDIYDTPGFYGLVASDESEIKAAVLGNLEQWYEGYMYNLKEMFVQHGEKGKGIGSSLLSELEKSIKDLNVKSVCLFTSKGDLTEKFYLKNKYTLAEDMVMLFKEI